MLDCRSELHKLGVRRYRLLQATKSKETGIVTGTMMDLIQFFAPLSENIWDSTGTWDVLLEQFVLKITTASHVFQSTPTLTFFGTMVGGLELWN
jgi:hypothetical protein